MACRVERTLIGHDRLGKHIQHVGVVRALIITNGSSEIGATAMAMAANVGAQRSKRSTQRRDVENAWNLWNPMVSFAW